MKSGSLWTSVASRTRLGKTAAAAPVASATRRRPKMRADSAASRTAAAAPSSALATFAAGIRSARPPVTAASSRG